MKKIYDINELPSPCWLLEESKLRKNMEIFERIQNESGAKILLALKGYALWKSFDIIRPTLYGCCASGLYEAKLAHEEFGREVHTYSPAFKDSDIKEVAEISHHLVFNTPNQFHKFARPALEINPSISLGLRVNPEYSQVTTEMYDPCGAYSRLGTTKANFDDSIMQLCDGLHFHALCEQDSSALEGVLSNFEDKFGELIPKLKWINFGGGHHITRVDYNVDKLIDLIKDFKSRHNGIEVYLEPGEAVGWQTGALYATVLDIVHNGIDIAILDTSAEAHMPDTILMPYRSDVRNSGLPNEKKYTYRLGGNTCLAGDIMGDYSFDEPLKIGDKIIFEDQMHYTMVKATTFNGIPLPSIAIQRSDGSIDIVKEFGYSEFKNRLS
ncbi:MAG: carboxynorspermidine decarboxylase [Sulfurovum sp. AS07-7]|nr:MAG: carboxynorspermidine decarboxylase [Sulfurovum sp. AS07-7]